MAANYQTVTTGDGRQLEYLSSGPTDGKPVLFHVGTPNCATEFSLIKQPAERLAIRLVCYSRPGYGESTEQPGRSVADTVADATTLLDHLGIDRFCTLG